MAEANHGSGKDCSTEPSHPSITGTACIDWVQETIAATEKDTRRQPWKKTFANPVDSGFDDGEDLDAMGDVQYQVMNLGEVRNVLFVASDIANKLNRKDYDSFCRTFCVGLPLLLLHREHIA
ncbi:hypothetical protein MMC22_006719 [Lobaria immixta]|nr:hypothetical protein [Lobaria immixta]